MFLENHSFDLQIRRAPGKGVKITDQRVDLLGGEDRTPVRHASAHTAPDDLPFEQGGTCPQQLLGAGEIRWAVPTFTRRLAVHITRSVAARTPGRPAAHRPPSPLACLAMSGGTVCGKEFLPDCKRVGFGLRLPD